MTRRFILLDHSIEDSAGHYLEYARRVLRAAKQEGFETILGVNKRAGGIVCPESDIIDRAFSRTFWENHAQNHFQLALGLLSKSGRIAGHHHLSYQYGKELRDLFRRIGAATDDIVFVPTLGSTELIGVAQYSGFNDAQELKWHLLFRRDVPAPGSVLDAKAHLNRARIRAAFAEAGKRFGKGSYSYYTDTDELTSRYEILGSGNFTTLPIPIDETLSVKAIKQTLPLVISYLGDAREEKGFHLLPSLISALRSAGFDETRVRFRIQANLPLGGNSSKAVRARETLVNDQQAGVEILEGPFDSCTYHRLISTSDVILIPYCPRSYAARSSGIFAEALAAGVPTIFPHGSWMDKCHGESGSVGFSHEDDISSALLEMLPRYSEYELRSRRFAINWRQRHSARNLVNALLRRTAEDTCGAAIGEPPFTNNTAQAALEEVNDNH